jgi:glucokinase-like ROK family protein
MANHRQPQKLTAQHQQQHNKALILSVIYAHAAISRVEVARLTGLSRATVSDLTQKLIDEGLVEESGVLETRKRVGKRPTLLAIVPDAYHLIAVDVDSSRVQAALLNLRGEVLARRTASTRDVRGAALVALTVQLIQALEAESDRPLLGLGLSTPGIIDPLTGVIYEAYNLGWTNLPLKARLAEHFTMPIYLGNDSNCAALGEYYFGERNPHDLVTIILGNGVGSGVVVGGKVVTGSGFSAGEIGHMPINGLDAVCACGRTGCLETVSSGRSILAAAQALAAEHPESVLGQLAADGPLDAAALYQAATAGDPGVIAVLEQAGHYLGMVLATLICLLNPAEIIFGGEFTALWDWIEGPMGAALDAHVLPQFRKQTVIRVTTLGADWIVLGAAAAVLDGELNVWQYECQSTVPVKEVVRPAPA